MKLHIEYDENNMIELSRDVADRLYQATFDSLLGVQRDAAKSAPYRTGNLRRSITSAIGKSGTDIVGAVGTNLVYARMQEFGGLTPTGGVVPPQLYMTGAVEANKDAITRRFKRYLAIKKI